MSKRLITTGLLALSLCFTSVSAFAVKVALVDFQSALNQVDEGVKAKDRLKKDFESKKKEIDKMRSNLESESKKLEKERLVLSQDALKSKAEGLQKQFLELQNKAAQFELDLKKKEQESAEKILLELRKIVDKMANEDQYDLVIENSSQTVLYAKDGEDITPKVISAYNKKR
jgi:outer membrane protein